MESGACFTLVWRKRVLPLDLVVCLFSLFPFLVKQAYLHLKDRRKYKRYLMHIYSLAYPRKHTNNLHLSQIRCITEHCCYCAAKLHSKATAEKKALSSTCNSDLSIYNLKALLFKFLIIRNGATGMENLQLGWNMRAFCSAARAVAGPLHWAPFSPMFHLCLAQVSAQPSTGSVMGTVSANARPWKLQINARRFSSCPVIFPYAGKHACMHESVFIERTCSVIQNKNICKSHCWTALPQDAREWMMKKHALKMGCSLWRDAEERLSMARPWGGCTHIF